MKFLIVSSEMPLYDRTSAGLRLFTLIQLLREAGHPIDYFLTMSQPELIKAGDKEFNNYKNSLEQLDIPTFTGSLEKVLKHNHYDAIIFEFYFSAYPYINFVRLWQSSARIIVDSVDLTFLRWHSKAQTTGTLEDLNFAKEVEAKELETYKRSDLILVLTDGEENELTHRLPGKVTFIVPNIHPIPALRRHETDTPELLFIGSFTHEPNIDAVKYFYHDIWPQIKKLRPDTRWIIIGPKPPDDIMAMQSNGIEILGWVPETIPYLNRCWISIAPLRFGAGMKGKVGEAMATGTPVVSTSFGAQGLDVQNRHNIFIADDAKNFSDSIIELIESKELRQTVGLKGRNLVESKYSKEAMSAKIPNLISLIEATPLQKQIKFKWLRKIPHHVKSLYHSHLGWRFHHSSEK